MAYLSNQVSLYLFVISRELTYLYSPSYFCSMIVILPIGLLKRVRKNPETIKYAIMLAGPCKYEKNKNLPSNAFKCNICTQNAQKALIPWYFPSMCLHYQPLTIPNSLLLFCAVDNAFFLLIPCPQIPSSSQSSTQVIIVTQCNLHLLLSLLILLIISWSFLISTPSFLPTSCCFYYVATVIALSIPSFFLWFIHLYNISCFSWAVLVGISSGTYDSGHKGSQTAK